MFFSSTIFIFIIYTRKATRHIVDQWLLRYSTPTTSSPNNCGQDTGGQNNCNYDVSGSGSGNNNNNSGSGATTPVRKISAHEFERGGLLKPIVNTIDGTPTFLSVSQEDPSQSSVGTQAGPGGTLRPQRKSRHELRQLDEKDLIFELVINKQIN